MRGANRPKGRFGTSGGEGLCRQEITCFVSLRSVRFSRSAGGMCLRGRGVKTGARLHVRLDQD